MPDKILRVTIQDSEGQRVMDLRPGEYIVVSHEPVYIADEKRNRDGSVVITLKRRNRQ